MEQRDAGSVLEAVRVIFEVVGDTQLIWSVARKSSLGSPAQKWRLRQHLN
jgi:hypothetical protein